MNRRSEFFFRRQLLIHPQFQMTLMGLNWCVITFLFVIMRIESSQVFSSLSPLGNFAKVSANFDNAYLLYQADRFNTALWIVYGIAMVASGLITLVVSYRFAGPLARLKSYFRDLGQPQNPVRELSFRSGDFFSDLPPLVNSAIRRCQSDAAGARVERVRSLKTG